MKQQVFEFLRSQPREFPVPLDGTTQEELVALMAAAIAAVHAEGVKGSNDTAQTGARPEQADGEAPGA